MSKTIIAFLQKLDMSHSCIHTLIGFFETNLPNIDSLYTWPIPKILGFENDANLTNAQNNIRLKHYLNARWHDSNQSEKENLAKVVVEDWGGVRTNRPGTIDSYVRSIQSSTPNMKLQGIASYSKIYSIVNLEKYAIYDARVSASLNAIQINAGVTDGVAFNNIPSRNKIIGGNKHNLGFMQHDGFKVKNLVRNGWLRVKRDQTYTHYLDILEQCLEHLPNTKLYELEMLLFAQAEEECLKAMQKP